jgi:hypothetical protein
LAPHMTMGEVDYGAHDTYKQLFHLKMGVNIQSFICAPRMF